VKGSTWKSLGLKRLTKELTVQELAHGLEAAERPPKLERKRASESVEHRPPSFLTDAAAARS
jgi:hypothetical protein